MPLTALYIMSSLASFRRCSRRGGGVTVACSGDESKTPVFDHDDVYGYNCGLLQYAIPLISKFEVTFYFFFRRRSGQGGPSFSKWLRAFLLQKELNHEVLTFELFVKEAGSDCIEKMTPRGT